MALLFEHYFVIFVGVTANVGLTNLEDIVSESFNRNARVALLTDHYCKP